jgi:predicted esterase
MSRFDISRTGTTVHFDEDVTGMKQSIAEISKVIQTEIENGMPSERIILGGFSQGCSMTYLVGLAFEKKLGGLSLLSGRLPCQEEFESVCSLHSEYDLNVKVEFNRVRGKYQNMFLPCLCSGDTAQKIL